MKKAFFWAITIISGLTILGSNIVNHTAVQGVQQAITPTITVTATPIATVPPTTIPTSTPTPVYVPPTYTPTPVPVTTTNQSGLSNDNYYTNSAGNEVHSPAYADSVPAGASAICGDGTYSFSQSRRGTCSHHGGVAQWL